MSDRIPRERRRLLIVSFLYSSIALVMFFVALFSSTEVVPKEQLVFWFTLSLASAAIPSIQALKVQGVEVELFTKLEEVGDAVDQVNDNVEDLVRKGRVNVYHEVAEVLMNLEPSTRLSLQKELTQRHLDRLGLTVEDLEKMLDAAEVSFGGATGEISEKLIRGVQTLQRRLGVRPVDGIIGEITYESWEDNYGALDENASPNP